MARAQETLSAPETPDTNEFRRFTEEELARLVTVNNDWLGVTPHFKDRTELLNLIQLDVLGEYRRRLGLPFDFDTILAENSPVIALSKRLGTHAVGGDITFKSMLKDIDTLAGTYADWLIDVQKGEKPYVLPFDEADRQAIKNAVIANNAERTVSLLGDFEQDFDALDGQPVWLDVAIRPQGNQNVYAAQLAGFAIHGSAIETAIEPVVINIDGEKGLLPAKGVYVQPELKIRV